MGHGGRPKQLVNENKTNWVQFRMNEGEKLRLLALCDRYELGLSAYIRQLIRREYELNFPEKKAPTPLLLGSAPVPLRGSGR